MITATTRELPSTRDPMELSHRSTTIAMLEYFANKRLLPYDKWGEIGAERLRLKADSTRQQGSMCAFCFEVHQCHLSSYLHIQCETDDEKSLLVGLGMPPHLFVGEDEEVYRGV